MLILVTYDVSTSSSGGCRRLRKVAKICLNYGQRVQNSVFECVVDITQFTCLKHEILKVISSEYDSIRFYQLGNNWNNKVEHFGIKEVIALDKPIIY